MQKSLKNYGNERKKNQIKTIRNIGSSRKDENKK